MIPWEHLGDARIPGTSDKLSLFRRDQEFSLRLERVELMNSRMHGSEEELARVAIEGHAQGSTSHVLVGGLGMGFTLRAALDLLAPTARVTVAELIPEVVDWNTKYLGGLAGAPLTDSRVNVQVTDVADLVAAATGTFDIILLDTDNGPEGTTAEANEWLYQAEGLNALLKSLKPGGVLAVWSAFPSRAFTDRLTRAGFRVEQLNSRARKAKGARHVIWLAHRR